MAMSDVARETIGEREYRATWARGVFLRKIGKQLTLSVLPHDAAFTALFDSACEKLGLPLCVHGTYGFLWEREGEYLALGVVEEHLQSEALALFVFDRLPRGRAVAKAIEHCLSALNL